MFLRSESDFLKGAVTARSKAKNQFPDKVLDLFQRPPVLQMM